MQDLRHNYLIKQDRSQGRVVAVSRSTYRREALRVIARELLKLRDAFDDAPHAQRMEIINAQIRLWERQRILVDDPLPKPAGPGRRIIEMPRSLMLPAVEIPQPDPPNGLILDSFPDPKDATDTESSNCASGDDFSEEKATQNQPPAPAEPKSSLL